MAEGQGSASLRGQGLARSRSRRFALTIAASLATRRHFEVSRRKCSEWPAAKNSGSSCACGQGEGVREAPGGGAKPDRSTGGREGGQLFQLRPLEPDAQATSSRDSHLAYRGVSEHAQPTAAYESPRTTKLYGRTRERLTQAEVERISSDELELTRSGGAIRRRSLPCRSPVPRMPRSSVGRSLTRSAPGAIPSAYRRSSSRPRRPSASGAPTPDT